MEILGSGGKRDPRTCRQGQNIALCNGSERSKCAAEGLAINKIAKWWLELKFRIR